MNRRPVTDLREEQMRAQLEREVHAERDEQEALELDRDAAVQAVTLTAFALLCMAIMVLAAVLGASVRVFGWASGLY